MVRLRDSWPFSLSSAPTVGNPCRPLQPESVSAEPRTLRRARLSKPGEPCNRASCTRVLRGSAVGEWDNSMAFLFFLGSRSRTGQAVLVDGEGSVWSPGSERHHAQNLAFKRRVDPASDGICDGFE